MSRCYCSMHDYIEDVLDNMNKKKKSLKPNCDYEDEYLIVYEGIFDIHKKIKENSNLPTEENLTKKEIGSLQNCHYGRVLLTLMHVYGIAENIEVYITQCAKCFSIKPRAESWRVLHSPLTTDKYGGYEDICDNCFPEAVKVMNMALADFLQPERNKKED